ncbi:MAG TPA: PepSY-associated TM helix domain-containing protein [Telluria sp.]|nr:PepSY-associated TM helix domain-containing protein [Telluria sp.]
MKPFIHKLHLWSGLVFGVILALQGLTGAALGWRHELDALLNPGLLQVAPPPGMQAGLDLRVTPQAAQAALDRLTQDPAYGKPNMLMFPESAGDVFIAWYRPAPGGGMWNQPVTRQVMVDPATLAVTGERNWGEAGLSRPLLMPTLFHLHRYLLAGDGGKVVVAIEGVLLAFSALTGIIVWWPKLTRAALWKAITFRVAGPWTRFSFQSHRALGFWIALPLLFSALSGVHFNMPDWTRPLVSLAGPVTPNAKLANKAKAATPVAPAVAVEAAQARFPQARVSRLSLPGNPKQPYEIRLRQPGELRQGDGATRVSVDASDGALLRVIDPLTAQGGDRVTGLLFPLHTGEAFGNIGRAAVSVYGLVLLALFPTGLTIWLSRRRARAKRDVLPRTVEKEAAAA